LSLARAGDDVTIICVRHDEGTANEEVRDGVRILRGPTVPKYEAPVVGALQRSPIGVLRLALTVRRVLANEDFDVAYFNQWPYLHVLLAPTAIRQRSGVDWCEYREGPIHRLFERLLPRMVGMNASVDEYVASRISAESAVRVRYLPTGVDIANYAPKRGARREGLLFLGRLVPNKNLPLLVRSYAQLRRRGVDVRLRIAGDGPEMPTLRRVIEQQEAETRASIEILGAVDEATKRELLASSSVLVLTPTRGGFPNVVAEAIASGLPIVTAELSQNGTATVIRRYGVGVAGEATPSGIADAVEEALGRREELAKRCLAVAPELDWRRVSDRLRDALASLRPETGVEGERG
jgi:glycosyltransferase involved in cell wall biosynthesis